MLKISLHDYFSGMVSICIIISLCAFQPHLTTCHIRSIVIISDVCLTQKRQFSLTDIQNNVDTCIALIL